MVKMGRHPLGFWLWLVMGILVGSARADPLDDFANNLISDLAPLLALFGERVTMQFLSQSLGMADCVALAMAPLGIITILVSAIRVGGPMWLKAIIGRAAENRAAVELDLMSSTSQEVCELYNGQNIVKCLGKGQIWEYICLMPRKGDSNVARGDEEISFRTLKDARNEGLLRPAGDAGLLNRQKACKAATVPQEHGDDNESNAISTSTQYNLQRFIPWNRRSKGHTSPSTSPENTLEQGTNTTARIPSMTSPRTPSGMTVIRNTDPEAPNISLNLAKYHDRRLITLVAVIGTLLQTGIVVFFGMMTYYPKIQGGFKKDGERAPHHAFPLTASGTILLVTGLLTCSYVVDNSTHEERYEVEEGYEIHTYWIQRSHTVSDQVFKSFAICSSKPQTVLLTSRRRHTFIEGRTNTRTQWMTVIGVLLGLAGFVFQFVGLRAMSSAASLAQLGAIGFMTIARALVRSQFSMPFSEVKLDPGSELDWLAGELVTRNAFLNNNLTPASEVKAHHGASVPSHANGPNQGDQWASAGLGNPQQLSLIEKNPCRPTRSWAIDISKQSPLQGIVDREKTPYASQLLVVRRELGKLAKYQSKTSKVAMNLALAVEEACNGFIDPRQFSVDVQDFVWKLEVNHDFSYDRKGAKGKGQQVEFALRLTFNSDRQSWAVLADDVDAALSLWIATAQKMDDNRLEPEELDFSNVDKDNDSWFRGHVADYRIRVLGPISTFGDVRIFGRNHKFGDVDYELVTLDKIESVGKGYRNSFAIIDSNKLVGCRWFSAQALEDHSPQLYATGRWSSSSSVAMCVKTRDSLEIRFAKDLLFAFMSSLAATIKEPLESKIDGWPPSETPYDLKLSRYKKVDLSVLVEKFVSLGFGSSLEAASAILVPLSLAGKLPSYDIFNKICSDLRSRYEASWELTDVTFWKQTFEALESCYNGYQSIGFGWMLTLLVNSIHGINSIITLRQTESLERAVHLEETLSYLSRTLSRWMEIENRESLSRLAKAHPAQGQDVELWSETAAFCEKLEEALRPQDVARQLRAAPDYSAEYARFFELSNAHMKVIRNEALDYNDATKWAHSRDILGATPLHYAAFVPESTTSITSLAEIDPAFHLSIRFPTKGAGVYAEDLHGYSPLHYAFGYGDWETVSSLCRYAWDTSLWDPLGELKPGTDGAYPTHVAAAQNNTLVIQKSLEHPWIVPHHVWSYLDFQGRTPIHWAIVAGHIRVVEMIWDHDYEGNFAIDPADKNVAIDPADKHGWKSIHLAVLHNKVDIVMKLCELSANIGEKDNDGRTPLALASKNGRLEAAMALLDHLDKYPDMEDARRIINAVDKDGNTPLHLSGLNGNFEIENELLRAGADWGIRNEQGQTAHEIFTHRDTEEMFRWYEDGIVLDSE